MDVAATSASKPRRSRANPSALSELTAHETSNESSNTCCVLTPRATHAMGFIENSSLNRGWAGRLRRASVVVSGCAPDLCPRSYPACAPACAPARGLPTCPRLVPPTCAPDFLAPDFLAPAFLAPDLCPRHVGPRLVPCSRKQGLSILLRVESSFSPF